MKSIISRTFTLLTTATTLAPAQGEPGQTRSLAIFLRMKEGQLLTGTDGFFITPVRGMEPRH